MRNFTMDTEAGESLAYANTYWSYIDAENGLPVKLTPEDTRGYELTDGTMEPKLEMDYAPRKIRLPGEYKEEENFVIQKHHLDTNHHVNNGQYVQMAMDYLPRDLEIRRLRVEYKKSAVLGDIIYPKVAAEDGVWTVVLENEENQVYAVIEVRGSLPQEEVL